MGEDPKDTSPSPEEIENEKREEDELLKESKEEEVRADIVKKHGLDEDTDKELIDSLTKEKLEDRKSFGKVVGQKRKWREKAQKPEGEEPPKAQPDEGKEKKGLTEEELEAKLAERDQKKDLEALDVSDELREQVETFVKMNPGTSVKQAMKSDYIKFRKEQEDKKRQEEEAGLGGSRRTRTGEVSDIKGADDLKEDSFDLETEEGRKEYEAWKKSKGIA